MRRIPLCLIPLFMVASLTEARELEVTLSFMGRPIDQIEAVGETEYLGPDSLRIEQGVKLTWKEGELADLKGIPVLLDRRHEQLTFILESDSLSVYYGDHSGPPMRGKFKLDAPFRLVGPGILVKMNSGRYFMEGGELKLFLPGSVWKRGANGFLMAATVGLVTLVLIINGRRTRQRLESDRSSAKRRR